MGRWRYRSQYIEAFYQFQNYQQMGICDSKNNHSDARNNVADHQSPSPSHSKPPSSQLPPQPSSQPTRIQTEQHQNMLSLSNKKLQSNPQQKSKQLQQPTHNGQDTSANDQQPDQFLDAFKGNMLESKNSRRRKQTAKQAENAADPLADTRAQGEIGRAKEMQQKKQPAKNSKPQEKTKPMLKIRRTLVSIATQKI